MQREDQRQRVTGLLMADTKRHITSRLDGNKHYVIDVLVSLRCVIRAVTWRSEWRRGVIPLDNPLAASGQRLANILAKAIHIFL